LNQQGTGIDVNLHGAAVDGQGKGFSGMAQGCLLKTAFSITRRGYCDKPADGTL
jgi:hypothetical protein